MTSRLPAYYDISHIRLAPSRGRTGLRLMLPKVVVLCLDRILLPEQGVKLIVRLL